MADHLGISDKTISAYETGRAIPPSSTLAKIAELTNVSVSKIVGETENDDEYNINRISERIEQIEQRLSNIEQSLIRLLNEKSS